MSRVGQDDACGSVLSTTTADVLLDLHSQSVGSLWSGWLWWPKANSTDCGRIYQRPSSPELHAWGGSRSRYWLADSAFDGKTIWLFLHFSLLSEILLNIAATSCPRYGLPYHSGFVSRNCTSVIRNHTPYIRNRIKPSFFTYHLLYFVMQTPYDDAIHYRPAYMGK